MRKKKAHKKYFFSVRGLLWQLGASLWAVFLSPCIGTDQELVGLKHFQRYSETYLFLDPQVSQEEDRNTSGGKIKNVVETCYISLFLFFLSRLHWMQHCDKVCIGQREDSSKSWKEFMNLWKENPWKEIIWALLS